MMESFFAETIATESFVWHGGSNLSTNLWTPEETPSIEQEPALEQSRETATRIPQPTPTALIDEPSSVDEDDQN